MHQSKQLPLAEMPAQVHRTWTEIASSKISRRPPDALWWAALLEVLLQLMRFSKCSVFRTRVSLCRCYIRQTAQASAHMSVQPSQQASTHTMQAHADASLGFMWAFTGCNLP